MEIRVVLSGAFYLRANAATRYRILDKRFSKMLPPPQSHYCLDIPGRRTITSYVGACKSVC